MRAFVRVVETGSFTKAAETLCMSRTTVTQLVQQLEAHLRIKLLNRTTRKVNVTSDGAVYYERVVRLLAELDDIESNLTYILQEQNEKNITLCVHPYIEAFIKKGLISLQWKWFFKFGQRIKVRSVSSYHLTEFHFLSSKDEEIKI